MKRLSPEEERQLLDECINWGRKDLLVKQYLHLIKKTVRGELTKNGVLHVEDDLEELQNDVFVRLFDRKCKRLRQYDPGKGKGLVRWIRMIARQAVRDAVAKKDPHAMPHSRDLIPFDEIREELALERYLRQDKSEKVLSIKSTMPHLTPAQRQVVQLHFFGNPPMPLEKIAALMNRDIKSIYSLKFRAIKKMKELLNE
ncbi:MAG: hypothetical protein CSB33_04695 [Desulfobacterales bacterium]|nr:MAG: hypothetical protein CSB33_04695 [Desulfobacterales bacterium]